MVDDLHFCDKRVRTGIRGWPWWHAWVLEKAEGRWRQGRITFVGAPDPAGFDSAAVVYRPCIVGGASHASSTLL